MPAAVRPHTSKSEGPHVSRNVGSRASRYEGACHQKGEAHGSKDEVMCRQVYEATCRQG